jgi:hypothetical protein
MRIQNFEGKKLKHSKQNEEEEEEENRGTLNNFDFELKRPECIS